MPTYLFECPNCGYRESRFLPMSKRNEDFFHIDLDERMVGHMSRMERIFTPFHFTAQLEKDKDENQLLRIITKSNSRKDWLEEERRQVEKNDADLARAEEVNHDSRYVPMSEIDVQGAWTAAHAGEEQLERWRRDNIKEVEFTVEEQREASYGNGSLDVSHV